jgi:non-ribosomal peptide synthetase component F
VLLGAFGTVLAAWSGSRRFSLNLTVFNRLPLHPAVPRLVGDFTGTTLLAFDLNPTEPFSARAARLQAQLWADLEHRYYSGVQVMRDLAKDAGARHALYPVVFTSHLACLKRRRSASIIRCSSRAAA